jgi:putative MATE family efflux protein
MKKNLERLEKMDIKKLIIQMSLPAMLSMITQALYNIVDSIFVAKISEDALTALSLSFPIQMIIISIFVGLGVGINSYMSRKLGEGKKDEAVNTAEQGLFIGLLIGLLLAVSSYIVPQYFFRIFTDDPLVLEKSITYTRIIMLFSFGCILTEACSNILRATGDMISSMKIQLTGALINIILDPLLIFGLFFFPQLGVKGAAIATVIGQLCAMCYALFLVLHNKSGLKLSMNKFHFSNRITGEIFKVGIPVMFMQMLASVMVTGVNLILAGFSGSGIAVFGAYFRIQSFIFMPVFGLTMGIMPIIGYNYGAGNIPRVTKTVKYGILYATSIMMIGLIIFQLFPHLLLQLFSSTPEMYNIGIPCLRILSISFLFSGCTIVLSTFFQSLGKGILSLVVVFLRQIILLLPIAFGLSKIMGLTGVWAAFPLSDFLTFILAGTVGLTLINKIKSPKEEIIITNDE